MALTARQIIFSAIGLTMAAAMMVKVGSPDSEGVMAVAEPSVANTAEASGRKVTERASQPSIVKFETGDPSMDKAIRDARERLAYFWEHYEQPGRGEAKFTLKVGVPVQSPDTNEEHIWVSNIRRTGSGLSGVLGNEPNWMKGKHAGDSISFTESMVSDWGFLRNGKMIGFYTTRVMLDDAAPEEAVQIRAMLGENPA